VGPDPSSDGVLSVALHPPLGLALCGTNDGALCLWSLEEDAPPLRTPPTAAGSGLSALAWRVPPAAAGAEGAEGADGAAAAVWAELLSAAEDGSVTRWRVGRGGGGTGRSAGRGAAAELLPLTERLQLLDAGGEVLGLACGLDGAEAYCALRAPPAVLPLCTEHRR
jgi:hypothetical protein